MADEKNRIGRHLQVSSAFWKPGERNGSVQAGMLTVDGEMIWFTTDFKYKPALTSEDHKEFVTAFNNKDRQDAIPALHGFSEEGECTLCKVHEYAQPGLIDVGTNQAITSQTYISEVLLNGMHVDGLDDECLDSATYSISGIVGILPKSTTEVSTLINTMIEVPAEAQQLVSLCLLQDKTEVQLKVFTSLSTGDDKRSRIIRPEAYIQVTPKTPKSLSYFMQIGNHLGNWASVFTGGSEVLESIRVDRGNSTGIVIAKRDGKSQLLDIMNSVRCSISQLAQSLSIWLSDDEAFRTVTIIAFGVLGRRKLFLETEFLSLSQALEGFHRATTAQSEHDKNKYKDLRAKIKDCMTYQQVHDSLQNEVQSSLAYLGEPSFRTRLTELLNFLSNQVSTKLCVEVNTFVSQVVNTRNYLTHPGSTNSRKRDIASGMSLVLLNQRLRAILRGLVVCHLKIPHEQADNVLVRQGLRLG